MENNISQPLSLERKEALKVFSILSALKTVPTNILQESFCLSLVATYTLAEAMAGAYQGLRDQGKNPNDYILNCMQICAPVESIANLSKPMPVPIATPTVSEKKKTVEQYMIDNVSHVFNLVGNASEQKAAQKVIAKFIAFADKKLSTEKN